MSKFSYLILYFVAWTAICFVGGVIAVGQSVDPLNVLRRCVENEKVTDRLQYEVRTKRAQLPSVSRSGSLGSQNIEAVIKREGDSIVVTGTEKFYQDGKFEKDESIHLVVTPDFLVVGLSGESARNNAGIVTTEQMKERLPGILCSGQFGFELDGYVGDGIRVSDLMLMEPDKVKYAGEKEINGFVCQQIDADTKYGFFSVYIDTANNHAVRRIVSIRRQNDLQYVGEAYFPHASSANTFTETLDNLEFKLLDGVYVPIRGNLQLIREDKDGSILLSRSEFERTNIALNPVFDKSTFSADFLKGEVVSNMDDAESGVVYVWDGKKPVPGFTMLEGTAVMQGYAGFTRLCGMLLGIVLVAIALYRMLRRKKVKS